MPSLRETLQKEIDAGATKEQLRARMAELGVNSSDLPLEYDEAKARGAKRKAEAQGFLADTYGSLAAPDAAPKPKRAPAAAKADAPVAFAEPALGLPEEHGLTRAVADGDVVPVEPENGLGIDTERLRAAARLAGLGAQTVLDPLGNVAEIISGKESPRVAERRQKFADALNAVEEGKKPKQEEQEDISVGPLAAMRNMARAAEGAVEGLAGPKSKAGAAAKALGVVAETVADPIGNITEIVTGKESKRSKARQQAFQEAATVLRGDAPLVDTSESNPIAEAFKRTTQAVREAQAPSDAGIAAKGATFLENAARDLGDVIAGLYEGGKAVVGFEQVPEGQRFGEGAKNLGRGVAETPGSALALGSSIAPMGENGAGSLYSHPFSTYLMVVEPLRAGAKAAAQTKFAAAAKPVIDAAVEPVAEVASKVASKAGGVTGGYDAVKMAVRRALEDGLAAADPTVASFLDDVVRGSQRTGEYVKALGERVARQIEKGDVELDSVGKELEPVEVPYTDIPVKGEPLAAMKESAGRRAAAAEEVATHRRTQAEGVQQVVDAAAEKTAPRDELMRLRDEARAEANDLQRQIDETAAKDAKERLRVELGRAERKATRLEADLLEMDELVQRADESAGVAEEAIGAADKQIAAAQQAAELKEAVEPVTDKFTADVERARLAQEALADKEIARNYSRKMPERVAESLAQAEANLSRVQEAPPVQSEVQAFEPERVQEKVEADFEGLPLQQRLAKAAEQSRQQALLEGFDPNAEPKPVNDVLRNWIHPGENALEVGRRLADYLVAENVDNPAAELAVMVREFGIGTKQNAKAIADYLIEQQKVDEASRLLVRDQGLVYSPRTVTKSLVVGPDGKVSPNRLSALADAELSEYKGGLEAADRQVISRLAKMMETEIGYDAPRSATTKAPFVDLLASQIADQVRSASEFSPEASKMLSPERIAQRLFDSLDDSSGALLRFSEYRSAVIDRLRQNAKAVGYDDAAIDRMARDVAVQLRSLPESSTAKSRFIELLDERGQALLSRADYAAAIDALRTRAPKMLARLQADIVRAVSGDLGDAAHASEIWKKLADEHYRFYRDETGKIDERVIGDVNAYAKKIARAVLDGDAPPISMPYDGPKVASQIRELLPEVSEFDPTKAAELKQVADRLDRFVPIGETNLALSLPRWFSKQFRGVDMPPELVNQYMDPDVAHSLAAHLAMVTPTFEANALSGVIHGMLQRVKAGLVAENVSSLKNNNISNAITLMLTTGDVTSPFRTLSEIRNYKRWKDSDSSLPADVAQDYAALEKTGMVSGTFAEAEIRKSLLAKSLREFVQSQTPKSGQGGAVKAALDYLDNLDDVRDYTPKGIAIRAALSKFPDAVSKLQEALRTGYQELGDIPFRMTAARREMGRIRRFIGALEPGQHIELPQSANTTAMLEVTPDGHYVARIKGAKGKYANEFVPTQEQLDLLIAKAADVFQERLFFDYNRLGNYMKMLRSTAAAPFSGMFVWLAKAADLPGKRGLVSTMMEGEPSYATNSPEAMRLMARDRMDLAMRRALLSGAAGKQTDDQDALAPDLPGALQMQAGQKMIVDRVTPQGVVKARDISAGMPDRPTNTVLSALSSLMRRGQALDLADDPEAFIRATEPVQVGDEKLPPTELARIQKQRRALRDVMTNRVVDKEKVKAIAGAVGHPLLVALFGDGKNGKFNDLFWSALVGRTPYAATQAALAQAGIMTGSEGLLAASGYTDDYQRRMRGGNQSPTETLFQWQLRRMLSIGASDYMLAEGVDADTGRPISGPLDKFRRVANDALKESVVKPAESVVRITNEMAKANPTPENKQRAKEALDKLEIAKKGIKIVLDQVTGHSNHGGVIREQAFKLADRKPTETAK